MPILSSEFDAQGNLTRSVDVTAGTTTIRNGAGSVTATRPATATELALAADAATETTKATLRGLVANAIAQNRTYLALLTPSNTQVAAQVRALTQQVIRAERLLGDVLDGTD